MHVRRLTLTGCVSLCVVVSMVLVVACTAMATLPDNRAYEMVSPIEKGGGGLMSKLMVTDASGEHAVVDGGGANSLLSSTASWMLETRTPTGWSGVQVGPSPATEASDLEQGNIDLVAVSESFSRFAFETAMSFEPRDLGATLDVYVRQGPTGPFTWASGPPSPVGKAQGPPLGNYVNGECSNSPECLGNSVVVAGASADLSAVVWGQREPLVSPPGSLAGSPADTHAYGYEVYESVNGSGQLVGLVPAAGGECSPSHGSCVVPRCGAAMGNAYYEESPFAVGGSHGYASTAGAVSKTGSQVIFTSPDPATESNGVNMTVGCVPPEVYVREDGTTTVQASASQKTNGSGPGGRDPNGPRPKTYAGSVEEGGRISTVFFTSSEELTETANTGGSDQGNDLYAYSLATGKLTDLTPENNTPGKKLCPNEEEICEAVEAIFLGSSPSGQLVYFTASSVLTAEPNSYGQAAKPGVSNLYLYNAATGRTTFIAPGAGVTGPRVGLIANRSIPSSSEVTPDGRHLVFLSRESLTAYRQEGNAEVYLYDAPSGRLVCASCNPSGVAPAESAMLPQESPEGTASYVRPGTLPAPRVVSDDGSRVFFTSPDQLTAEAPSPALTQSREVLTKGRLEPNVYEFEDGQIHLVAAGAALLTVTPSGNDVFFNTLAQLVAQDRDGSPDVYDARVGGGFPQLALPACSGTSCQGVPAASPVFATPASVTFGGVGNFPPPPAVVVKPKAKSKSMRCRRGFVRKQNRCVKRSAAKKSAKGRK